MADSAYAGFLPYVTMAYLVRKQYIISLSALPLYEYVLTISQEVEHIWGNECGRASRALFSLNRFVMLLMAVGNVLQVVPFATHKSCEIGQFVLTVSQLMLFVVLAVVSALRVHALSVQNWYLSLPTLLLGLVPFITNTCNVIGVYYLARPIPTLVIPYCMALVPNHLVLGNSNNATIITRICVILSELIVVAVTLRSTYRHASRSFRLDRKPSLVALLLRDGVMYFLLLFVPNLSDIFVLHVADNGALIQFILPMSSILVSRFLLNSRSHALFPVWRIG